jgi:hypothetical protein
LDLLSCPFTVTNAGDDLSKANVDASTSVEGTVGQITLTMTDGSRSGTGSVQVATVNAASPLFEMVTSGFSVFNPSDSLRVKATVTTSAACNVEWSGVITDANGVVMGSVDLPSIALTPTTIVTPSNVVEFPLYLALGSGSLNPRSSYLFQASCRSVVASVSVATNGAPYNGKFSVTPPSGTELSTPFDFTATSWFDENLPLSYQFGFLSGSEVFLLVQGKSENSAATTNLPSVPGGNVTCQVQVFDAFGASTVVQTYVLVSKTAAGDLRGYLSSMMSVNAAGGGTGSQDYWVSDCVKYVWRDLGFVYSADCVCIYEGTC